ncbi:MAG: NosD domain-containing protein [bacterium]|nr:NosD domain-containing protein [bacterium]
MSNLPFICAVVGAALLSAPARAVTVGTAAELAAAVAAANAGGDPEILLRDGTYTLDDMLWIEAAGVTVRGLSGNRDAVVIRGRGMGGGVSHVFNVNGSGFTVRDLTMRDVAHHAVQLQVDVAQYAVHFWSGSRDTLVEANLVVNCDRGIGFGMSGRGHVGGIIRNNMIYHDAGGGFADVGIAVEEAPGAQVYNNTVFGEHDYPNAIEYRFPETTGAGTIHRMAVPEHAPGPEPSVRPE